MNVDQFAHWLKGLADSTATEGYCHPTPEQWDLIRSNLDASLGIVHVASGVVTLGEAYRAECVACGCEPGASLNDVDAERVREHAEWISSSLAKALSMPWGFLQPAGYLEIGLKAVEESVARRRRQNIETCERQWGGNSWVWSHLDDDEVERVAGKALSEAWDEAIAEDAQRSRAKKLAACVRYYGAHRRQYFEHAHIDTLSLYYSRIPRFLR
ncbi:TPA: hypothetical protein ACU967_002260 [Burkholderia contaminans]|uniref:hypothetical protein n=1 Tax=Burkholderia contaminans TaxID=488447 RepID=UPI000CFEC14A|nr:hypothetical protein [Burkholderia contaminans]HDR9065503.1 hypothetical protein [Burkholderia vietnamiensis]MBM6427942.1 hypothetical protein [Burkholderia contaminans]MCA7876773.1 hypothetical protein [Burkholderia contaminans]MDN8024204.1 hypothetical protein [Burkholderia contaminans]PRG12204.1 hypothetical protein C6Q17_14195 [Burkholderia contaminans]